MIELIEDGVKNIICMQPFGCLPNHITGKGQIKELKRIYKDANINAYGVYDKEENLCFNISTMRYRSQQKRRTLYTKLYYCLYKKYIFQLNEMMDEWTNSNEKIIPWSIRKSDYHNIDEYIENCCAYGCKYFILKIKK